MNHNESWGPQGATDWEYIFGFGSIINTNTHAPWVSSPTTTAAETATSSTTAGKLPGQRAIVRAGWGYRRGWNFRSNTGFTALGVVRCAGEDAGDACDINGVVFRVTREMLADFDRREVGYDRVELPKDQLVLHSLSESVTTSENLMDVELQIRPTETIWVYVPQQTLLADEDHPILQSYVDTVCQGCLEWGGEDMCRQFVASTFDWSPFFLNDTPSSRRPWLFRKEYNTIDKILQTYAAKTHFDDRKHPEEFASAFLIKLLRGSWGVPPRNPVFIGRDAELSQMHARLLVQRLGHSSSPGCSVAKVEIAGMGGVGKSQLAAEYCYRYFPSYYGLVIWVAAQSAESIAAAYRQLMADTTDVDVKDKDTDEVVGEVKTRLFRSKVPWLLVFDNLEDSSLLEKFVPNGGTGHILVTTRLVDIIDFGEQTMVLGCFQPEESLELLCRATSICTEQERTAAEELSERLGQLPLALGMAAAYMRRCDVNCEEYLSRYVLSPNAAHLGGVSASLSLSLNAIQQENPAAWQALQLLAWIGPDQITKKLLRLLMQAKLQSQSILEAGGHRLSGPGKRAITFNSLSNLQYWVVGGVSIVTLAIMYHFRTNRTKVCSAALCLVASTALATNVHVSGSPSTLSRLPSLEDERSVTHRKGSQSVFEQTDGIWTILKSFSLLVVKEGQGSIHRLLSQSLRLSQDEEDSLRNMSVCLRSIQKLWTFKPERSDTWAESTSVLEHAKSLLSHIVERKCLLSLETAALSREVGVFSAMALNRFKEAQLSLELSLVILGGISINERSTQKRHAHAATLHELGRVFRYQGQFQDAEVSLREALELRQGLARTDNGTRHGVAATLYELGVLEVKKHNLDSAEVFLQQALDLRRSLEHESPNDDIEADCASTLHQLAAVYVAKRPPSLDVAEMLLTEALSLSMQVGQRAATLKQLARVAIRRGAFETAEHSLSQALELYAELYGENSLHINVAAVKFQQGALAFQREQLEEAWLHFSECLRARRHVYSYSQGNHLEVSTVLHELGCVALTQKRTAKAEEMLSAEGEILDQLYESSSQRERIFQARLTNLSWLRKCAKALGDEEKVRLLTAERSFLKRQTKDSSSKEHATDNEHVQPRTNVLLQQEALRCRNVARQFALAKDLKHQSSLIIDLQSSLTRLSTALDHCRSSQSGDALVAAIQKFHLSVVESVEDSTKYDRSTILRACDDMRVAFRDYGLQVNDTVQGKKSKS